MSKKTQKKTLKKPVQDSPAPHRNDRLAKPAAKKATGESRQTGRKRRRRQSIASGASKPLKSQRPKAAAKSSADSRATVEASAEVESPAASETIAPQPGHAALAEGTKAPAFHLPRDGGATVSLSDFAGQKLVLFFYPRADTPGCTKEAIDFTRLARAFAESRTAVLGVSADPPKAQEAFRDKHQLTVPLASDETARDAGGLWGLGRKIDVWQNLPRDSRTTVLIGADSRIIRIWRHVKVDGHADEVLAAAQSA